MSLERQLRGYRLTTFEILYHLPDHPAVLQTFTHQLLDLAPRYPELQRFLAFWEKNIEARLHSVKVASAPLLQPPTIRLAAEIGRLH